MINWIHVDEELPELNEEVLVWLSYPESPSFCAARRVDDERNRFSWTVYSSYLTHWTRINPPINNCTECEMPGCPGIIICPECGIGEHGLDALTQIEDHGHCHECQEYHNAPKYK